ncbi:hypothetical protein IQ07DRAFT_650395 [Pyrenochaeta sp. DS3sAY3a]|nr:hypothetical protein IQ07DRAFT_650395 [Pyrenochaeta sp. DS3sAY3a]
MTVPSTQARLTLVGAFDRFAATVTPADQRLFSDTKLKDVRDAAIQIERQLRARRTQRNMARLDPFLRGVEHYSKVVEVLCNGTPYLSWVWAPVKLMLMVTVDSIGAFETLINAYGKIADMMPRLDRLANALVDDLNFQNVLALLYSDIIEFHRRAYKFVRRKSWAIFFSSMWSGFESRFDSILERMAYHSELINNEAIAADISSAVRHHQEEKEKWAQQERDALAAKLRTVLSWLQTSDYLPADTLRHHLQDCSPDSCNWFVQHDKTQLWLSDSSKNPLVWLHGKPGAGKSIICASLVQHVEATNVDVFYYFCTFTAHSSGQTSRLLQSLVSQITQKHHHFAAYIHDVYLKAHPLPTKVALLKLLSELIQGLDSVRLIVDGIDEWDARDQKDLLKDLSQMVSTDRSSHICKILIASRDTLDISRILRKKDRAAAIIALGDSTESLAISDSITRFVDKRMSDIPDLLSDLDPDASITSHIKRSLLEKSQGMFLWVRVVLDLLDTVYSPEELSAVVDDLPSDLETLYGRILDRLCNVPGAHSHGGVPRIISLICFAQRPLHKQELLHALSVPAWGEGNDMQSVPISSILDHCKPFVEELPDSSLILVHFSVKEFFLAGRSPHIVPAIRAELDLASVCAVMLTHGLRLLRPGEDSADLVAIGSGAYRLLPYALSFWIHHCILFAAGGGQCAVDHPLPRHLTRLYYQHEQISGGFKDGESNASPTEPQGKQQDDQLKHFANLPIYALMKAVLHIKRLVSQHECEDDAESFAVKNDQTLFSKLGADFEKAVVYLLSKDEVAGIPQAKLRAFQKSYASAAFRCRFLSCTEALVGFASQQLRDQHEKMHFQRVYCKVASCQYNRVGFVTKNALRLHTRTYHSKAIQIPIPPALRRTSPTTVPKQSSGQQQLQRAPTPEGATQRQGGSPPPPRLNFDPSLAPPGMPPQFYQRIPQNPMMRPPSSHPGANFGQQLTPQQIEAMRNGAQMPNGWRGPPQPGMMSVNRPAGGPRGQNPHGQQLMGKNEPPFGTDEPWVPSNPAGRKNKAFPNGNF